ncbi:MAG: 5'-methylthioadenosine/S-adenosylhomocysteine nucleosidase family protein [Acidimicrobiales bacterium]
MRKISGRLSPPRGDRGRLCLSGALVVAASVALAALAAVLTPAVAAIPAPPTCVHRVLILSAMPLELNPLVAKATLDPASTVRVNDRTFYVGRLAGVDVVLALTGIGPVNATETTTTAVEHFRCAFRAVMFSGVAGSNAFIGDVMVPRRWTLDGAKTFVGTDAAMYATARTLQGSTAVKLAQDLPVGDAACLCGGIDAPTPVHLQQKPRVRVGGDGATTDPFGGHAAPCTWAGGDIAGCEPCVLSGEPGRDTANFAANAHQIPGLLLGLLAPTPASTATTIAGDEETAAVDTVAHRYRVPFLGIRAVSDGKGDPLHLPGFPSQFFVYRQLAGNNAAAVTIAFLKTWAASGLGT